MELYDEQVKQGLDPAPFGLTEQEQPSSEVFPSDVSAKLNHPNWQVKDSAILQITETLHLY